MPDDSRARTLSTPTLGLIWFGASVSLAEILTGTFFAPLGWETGLVAILLGHLIGCVLFALVALASARTGQTAMRVAGRSFGHLGAKLFSAANVVQLVGWTAIMILSGATAAALLVPQLGFEGWSVVIGALIVAWIAVGIKRMGRIQSIASVLLFGLTIAACFAVFSPSDISGAASQDALSFGAAVELAAAMPLSWLPVVGDYTCKARRSAPGALASTLTYGLGSCWMFAVGLGCALFAGSDDIAAVLDQAGFGVVGILIVVLSTVTTTFLDAQSAGISAEAIHPKLAARPVGIAAAVLGTALAILAPVGDFEDFLYLIGSVFAPMAAIVVADCLILKRNSETRNVDWRNVALWACGFALYRFSLGWDIPCGNTLPVMVIIIAVAVSVEVVARRLPRLLAHSA